MASGLIGNEVPFTGLRVRVPCPPLGKFSGVPQGSPDFHFKSNIRSQSAFLHFKHGIHSEDFTLEFSSVIGRQTP